MSLGPPGLGQSPAWALGRWEVTWPCPGGAGTGSALTGHTCLQLMWVWSTHVGRGSHSGACTAEGWALGGRKQKTQGPLRPRSHARPGPPLSSLTRIPRQASSRLQLTASTLCALRVLAGRPFVPPYSEADTEALTCLGHGPSEAEPGALRVCGACPPCARGQGGLATHTQPRTRESDRQSISGNNHAFYRHILFKI